MWLIPHAFRKLLLYCVAIGIALEADIYTRAIAAGLCSGCHTNSKSIESGMATICQNATHRVHEKNSLITHFRGSFDLALPKLRALHNKYAL